MFMMFFTVTITAHPMEYDGTYYTVKVKMDGRDHKFLVDTGAPHSTISAQYCLQHKDKIKLISTAKTFGKHQYYFMERRDQIKIDNVAYFVPMIKQDMSDLEVYRKLNASKEYVGILGIDFMVRYSIKIDFYKFTLSTCSIQMVTFLSKNAK